MTIRDMLIERMKSSGIEGEPYDFLECMQDFLYEYSEHLKLTEPYAVLCIRAIKDVASMSFDDEVLNGIIQG